MKHNHAIYLFKPLLQNQILIKHDMKDLIDESNKVVGLSFKSLTLLKESDLWLRLFTNIFPQLAIDKTNYNKLSIIN